MTVPCRAVGVALLTSVAASGLWVPRASACENQTVRDGAFAYPRGIHKLCVIANAGDADADRTHARLATWLESAGKGLNVELVRVCADENGVDWPAFGIPSAPPSMPVVVLAGRRGHERKGFYIHHWAPGPGEADLAALRSSPARDALRRELIRHLAVLLYVPGTGPDAGKAKVVIDAVAETGSAKDEIGVTVVRVDRTDVAERLLLSFIGVPPMGPDWVAVVFARGTFMPPLTGDEIAAESLEAQLTTLIGPCTCLQTPAVLGVDIPMLWNASFDAVVVPVRSGPTTTSAPSAASTAAAALPSPVEGPIFSAIAWTLAGIVIAVVGVTAVLILRTRPDSGT